MGKFFYFALIFCIPLYILGFATVCLTQSEMPANFGQYPSKMQNDNEKEAERIWELAIEAKGGREKLHKIENIVESSEGSYYSGLRKIKSHSEDLIVFPDKWWSWDDNRPSNFGLRMTMYNFGINKQYVVQFNGIPSEWKLMPIESNNKRFEGMTFISYLLPETKWWKLTPEKLSDKKIGSLKVDVVQTRLNGNRVDFSLDKRTHLPIKISYFLSDLTSEGEHISYETYLSDYIDYQGIKVPTKVDNEKITYQFNVEYNKEIFKTPPLPIEAAAEAWKIKR